jgi:hypothetical protein
LPRLPAQLLRLWHVLSLDAPTVAALWCWTLARAVHIHLPFAAPFMLALGTWLLYVADRLLDGMVADRLLDGTLAPESARLRERHLFHRRHRAAFLAGTAFGGIVLTTLVVRRMPGFVVRAYMVLGVCALLYLLLVHIRGLRTLAGLFPRALARLFSKELAVGIIFACATITPTWERLRRTAPAHAGAPLLLLLPLFAALCTLNCIAIEIWEMAADRIADCGNNAGCGNNAERSGPLPGASPASDVPDPLHSLTRVFGQHLTLTSLLLAAAAAIGAGFQRIYLDNGAAAGVALMLSLSALLFAVLNLRSSVLTPRALCIAADAVLLTPVLLLPVLR